MEEITFEDGSGLRGTDACVLEVREQGQWIVSTHGAMYYDADGSPWIACPQDGSLVNNDGPVPFYEHMSMPDTSMHAPSGLPLDGIGFVLVLAAMALTRRNRN